MFNTCAAYIRYASRFPVTLHTRSYTFICVYVGIYCMGASSNWIKLYGILILNFLFKLGIPVSGNFKYSFLCKITAVWWHKLIGHVFVAVVLFLLHPSSHTVL